MTDHSTPQARQSSALAKHIVGGELQDGMLAHYNAEAPRADVNVESKIDRDPRWKFREMMRNALDRGEPR